MSAHTMTVAILVNFALLVTITSGSAVVQQSASDSENQANPIRRVVTMLQGIQKKISADSDKEKKLFDQYMCYCQNAGTTLQGSIDTATDKVPQVDSQLKEAIQQKAQLEQAV